MLTNKGKEKGAKKVTIFKYHFFSTVTLLAITVMCVLAIRENFLLSHAMFFLFG